MVVVTILVILLALIAPTLDQAVYQAELTACGAKLKAVAGGIVGGAVERKRMYPERTTVQFPILLNRSGAGPIDERPVLRAYLNAPLSGPLTCPLARRVDLDAPVADSNVASNYALWWGWSTAGNERRMRRVGDRWTWEGRRFDTLAGDAEYYASGNTEIYSSHPDADGVMYNNVIETSTDASSMWQNLRQSFKRGIVDLNHAFEDGSVIRYAGIPQHQSAQADPPTDDRLADVPLGWSTTTNTTVDWHRIPKGR